MNVKGYATSTHRARTPAETYAAYAPVGARLGVTRVANITGLDHVGIPVYAAVRPNARSLSVAMGKGPDDACAMTSALMESIEHWHAENVDLPVKHASLRELRAGARVIDPAWLRASSGPAGLAPLQDGAPIDWIEATDLFGGSCWVPRDAVHLDHTRPPESRPFASTGNGLASGNHALEATLHALFELIERDATTLWLQGTGDERKIDLATVDDPIGRALLAKITAAGLLVAAYDTTSEIGVPTYACIVADPPRSARTMGYFWGFGCHLAPHVALCRALTEAVQCRIAEISGSRDDILADAYRELRSDEELTDIEAMIRDDAPTRRYGDRPSLATETFDGDLGVVLEHLRRASFGEALAVDLSRADVGVPVVQAIVPGLEGFRLEGYELTARGRARVEAAAR
jgi:ribosomal protein S12 methylthiotransferase accessory factor